MNPTMVGMIVFGCAFGGALLGIWLRAKLPEHHLDAESRETVKLGIELIALMIALVLGLVIASAKSAFDAVSAAEKSTAVDVLTLDRLLDRYGPETSELRGALKDAVARRIDMIWPQGSPRPTQPDPWDPSLAMSEGEGLTDQLRALTPRDDYQRSLQARAVDLAERILQARWLVFTGSEASFPLSFLVVMLFWLTITFGTFGLLGARNATVLGALFVFALSVGSAVFLILELDQPFDGVLKVSAEPLRYAHAHLNQ